MSVQQRRAEEKEQRREAIIDAAEQVFTITGFEAATMDEVAKVARVSRALVYLYFKNKSDLHFAICVRALQQLRERFRAVADGQGEGFDKVVGVGRTYFAFAGERPSYFSALSRFEMHSPADLTAGSTEYAVFEAGRAVHEVTVECLVQGMQDGSIRADLENPLLAALSLWAFVHGLIQLAHTKAHFFDAIGIPTTQFVDYAMAFAMRGLRPETAGQPQ